MNSQQIKVSVMRYLLLERNQFMVLTETLNNADILMVNFKHVSHEYEVKVSKADFLNEFNDILYAFDAAEKLPHDPTLVKSNTKFWKHKYYRMGDNPKMFLPNFFSFAVPTELAAIAYNKIMDYDLPYGLIQVEGDYIRHLKPAERLHDLPASQIWINKMMRRASFENYSLRKKLLAYSN